MAWQLRRILFTTSLAGALALTGCASQGPNKDDPFEGFNRGVYRFNRGLDKAVLKPVATAYDTVTPEPVRQGVGNVFRNLGEVSNIANNLLQLKVADAGKDVGRFLLNSTVGMLGLFDVASKAGIKRSEEDFGQTLGYWGVDSGPYLMLPLLGPSTLRDGLMRPLDSAANPVRRVEHVATRNSLYGLRVVDERAALFPVEQQLEDALDEYAFVRDAYLQRREYLVKDGAVEEPAGACEGEEGCAESW